MTEHEQFIETTVTGGELPPDADFFEEYEKNASMALANLDRAITEVESLHLYGDKDLARLTRKLMRANNVAQKPF